MGPLLALQHWRWLLFFYEKKKKILSFWVQKYFLPQFMLVTPVTRGPWRHNPLKTLSLHSSREPEDRDSLEWAAGEKKCSLPQLISGTVANLSIQPLFLNSYREPEDRDDIIHKWLSPSIYLGNPRTSRMSCGGKKMRSFSIHLGRQWRQCPQRLSFAIHLGNPRTVTILVTHNVSW